MCLGVHSLNVKYGANASEFYCTKRVFCYLFVKKTQITTGDEKQLLAKKLAMNWIKAGNQCNDSRKKYLALNNNYELYSCK